MRVCVCVYDVIITCLYRTQGVEALIEAEKKHQHQTGISIELLGLPQIYVDAARKRLAQKNRA